MEERAAPQVLSPLPSPQLPLLSVTLILGEKRKGGSEAEVRALWRGASLAPWELEAFAERFGAPFER